MSKQNEVTCILPDYVLETTLASVLRYEEDRAAKTKVAVINARKWDLPLPDEHSLSVRMDWSGVLYFDDAALLQLILVQHLLLKSGVNVTHFTDGTPAQRRLPTVQEQTFPCKPHVLRQLGAVGYTTQWVSERFGGSPDEVYRLSIVNHLRELGPLERQHSILPIIACQSEHGLTRWSTEDQAIRRYEDDAAMGLFVQQDGTSIPQCKLIASGEFGHLVVRQCRKNVVEHAKPWNLALSMARIVRLRDINQDWNLDPAEWLDRSSTPLAHVLSTVSEDTPVLDIMTLDDGSGISETLETTWMSHTLNVSDAWTRVDRLVTEDWPRDAVILEFSVDKDGSRKTAASRSSEQPGLSRIREIAARDQGELEVTSGRYRIVHEKNLEPKWTEPRRLLNNGTAVRLVVPLQDQAVSDTARRIPRTSASVLVGRAFEDVEDAENPVHIICLHQLWSATLDKHATELESPKAETAANGASVSTGSSSTHGNGSIEAKIETLTDLIRERLDDPPATARVAVLDWAELPWDEHQASCFLEKMRDAESDGHGFRLPVVHINVPWGLLVLSRRAVRKYCSVPPLPTCIFLENGSGCVWLGLAVPENKCRLSHFVSRPVMLGLFGDHESYDEQFLRLTFTSLLEGRGGVARKHDVGVNGRALAREYLGRCRLFKEREERDYSDGTMRPSGTFDPVVSLKDLRGAIAATFIATLRKALESDACAFPSKADAKGKRGRSRRDLLVRLPNGCLVERYYRCDGLLDYVPKPPHSLPGADTSLPQIRFRDELAAHLVDVAREIESHTPGRFDIVISCTSPTHWFVHQIADRLSDTRHQCAHFVAKRASTVRNEFEMFRTKRGAKALVFTDVVSTGYLASGMLSVLKSKGIKIAGLIALVDTRTLAETAETAAKGDPLASIDRENRVVFVHMPVKKRRTGQATWRIDPETLEPQEVSEDTDWTESLAGVGALAVPGQGAADWLVDFAALRHKHYNHGGHHSEFVCDVKRLFVRPEIRTTVGGRLNLYIRRNSIDLVVYPNHSNAYMMADMLREICGSDKEAPATQVALCRHATGPRAYVLPPTTQVAKPKKVLLLDDGFVTGGTMRSLIAAVLLRHPGCKEIHVVVFSNEAMPAQTRYWTSVGAGSPLALCGQKRGRGAFLAPKFHFSSFVSLPHPTFTEEGCPLCRRQRDFQVYSRDQGRTIHEREFYRSWAASLLPTDLDHASQDITTESPVDFGSISRSHRAASRTALAVAKFDILLQRESGLDELVRTACQDDYPTHVRIHCLRSLLHLGRNTLGGRHYEAVWQRLLETIGDSETTLRQRLLAVKACVWEQTDSPLFSQFCELLQAAAAHLGDPLILGGVIAYARLAFPPGHYLPPWGKMMVSGEIDKILVVVGDADVRAGLTILRNLLTGTPATGLGAGVVRLKKALLPRQGHSNARDDIKRLSEQLSCLKAQRSPDEKLLRAIPSVAMRLVDEFADLDKAARVALSHETIQSAKAWESSLDAAYSRLTPFRHLMEIDLTADPKLVKTATSEAISALAHLRSVWFASEKGYVRRLLRPFFQFLLPEIEEAIAFGEREFAEDHQGHRVVHDVSDFRDGGGMGIEVLCHPRPLARVLHNVVSNIWKHVVPWSIDHDQETIVKWTYRPSQRRAGICVTDNGPGLPEGIDLFQGDGGHATLKPQIEEYDAMYDVFSTPKEGTEVVLTLHSRRISR
jgi:orotate phosphoribosyltransferase